MRDGHTRNDTARQVMKMFSAGRKKETRREDKRRGEESGS
jgi:hypothetical protein